jgi:hypothetical protein
MLLGSYLSKMYQFGYVTKDIERAISHFRRKMGIEEFVRLETDAIVDYRGGQAPFRIKVALANLGDKQVELIEPIEGVNDFYEGGLDLDGAVAVLHHFGVLVEGPEANWDAMKGVVRECGYDIPLADRGANADRPMHFAYADTRADYGHYIEFLWRGAEAQRGHDSMPNQAH